ncbi:MAG: AraC family ligand binding domain-containing protein, partial [Planctomycetota bacterium]|nr:AraC family ligand binding domain-containing protein [Planctomycetota bacterium]
MARRGRPAKAGGTGQNGGREAGARWCRAWMRALARPPEILHAHAISVGDVWGERVHSTPSHEWIHVLQGHATIRIRGRAVRVGPRDTLVIPQDAPHRDIREQGRDYRVLYVFFRWDAGRALLERLDPARLARMHDAAKQHLHALAGELEREYLGDDPGAPERMQGLLCEALLALARGADRVARARKAS